MSLLGLLFLGFVLGMKHATDADHVVAVSTIVSRERSVRVASLLGVLWGCGHTLTILVVGGVLVIFELVLPPRVGLTLELLVALMLISLGVMNLGGLRHALATRFGLTHRHPSAALAPAGAPRGLAAGQEHSLRGRLGLYQVIRPLVIGVVHGLSGSAAVAPLVLTQRRERAMALLCLGLFGLGTIAGMMLITSLMALPMVFAKERFAKLERHGAWISGALSIGFGAVLVYQIGFGDGLFTAAPRWTPR